MLKSSFYLGIFPYCISPYLMAGKALRINAVFIPFLIIFIGNGIKLAQLHLNVGICIACSVTVEVVRKFYCIDNKWINITRNGMNTVFTPVMRLLMYSFICAGLLAELPDMSTYSLERNKPWHIVMWINKCEFVSTYIIRIHIFCNLHDISLKYYKKNIQ